LTGDYDDEVATVVAKWDHRHVNAHTSFTSLINAATYTTAQLMRDAYHPTFDTGGGVLAGLVATQLGTALTATGNTPEITGRVVNYLYGNPTVGSWSFQATTNTVGPTDGPLPRISDQADQGLKVTSSGAKVTFPDTTTSEHGQVWFHYGVKLASGGAVDFYVDRGTGSEKKVSVNTTDANLGDYYPKSVLVGNDLSAGSHTIEAETTSANQVVMFGVTVVGAP
ncbi:MAG: hypothetical protein ACREXY_28880, partial [Gammaproteobacteria bacterium]